MSTSADTHGGERDAVAPPQLDLDAYLEAKRRVDAASLNQRVAATFSAQLSRLSRPRIIDIGTGSGAMLRRLLDLGLPPGAQLIGVDRDRELLRAAERRLTAAGWPVAEARAPSTAAGAPTVTLVAGDPIVEQSAPALGVCDVVTAHTVVDLLPLAATINWLDRTLVAGGILYATICFDGETQLFPTWRDAGFEQQLVAVYHASMDARRVQGHATGGRHSGRRLLAALTAAGYRLLAVGSSDWNVCASASGAASADASFLSAILGMMAAEAGRAGLGSAATRARWLRERQDAAATGELTLLTHQLDMCVARGPRQARNTR